MLSKNELYKKCILEAAKSPCFKRKVGAVLAREVSENSYIVLSTGHNHNIKGEACELANGDTSLDVIHAEMACIENWQQFFSFDKSEKLVMFVTFEPCPSCLAALAKYNIAYEVVGEFMKFDKTKLRMALVPASFSQACARALQYGAKKYKVNNWRKTPDIESYISALQRHFDAWREGEEFDIDKFDDSGNLVEKGSGLSHLDHMAANLAFLIELKHLPKIKDESLNILK